MLNNKQVNKISDYALIQKDIIIKEKDDRIKKLLDDNRLMLARINDKDDTSLVKYLKTTNNYLVNKLNKLESENKMLKLELKASGREITKITGV